MDANSWNVCKQINATGKQNDGDYLPPPGRRSLLALTIAAKEKYKISIWICNWILVAIVIALPFSRPSYNMVLQQANFSLC
jgi:hypothetical protein